MPGSPAWGHSHEHRRRSRIEGLVPQPLEPTHPRRDRHDGDLQSAICLDAVHRPSQPKTRNDAGGTAVDRLAADHPANLVFAVSGLPGRPLRPPPPHFSRCFVVWRQLDPLRVGRQYLGALLDLWPDRRVRHRHHLCRHHRPDGALVPRPSRACHRPRRGGLRVRRLLHQFPHRQHDQKLRLCPHARRVGGHPGRHRHPRGAMAAHAARELSAASCRGAYRNRRPADPPQLLAARDAAKPGLLSAVRDDEHDVDVRNSWSCSMSDRSPRILASPTRWS